MALLKMTIFSLKSFDIKDIMKPRIFMAMFNPASYKMEYAITKDTTVSPGAKTQDVPASAINPQKMTFDFLIDGTGANGDDRIVLLEVKKFEKTVMPEKKDISDFESSIGRAVSTMSAINPTEGGATSAEPINLKLELPKLLLVWGTFVFSCEIESYSVNYTLFNQLGIPLRATISATFAEVPAPKFLDDFTSSSIVETITDIGSFLSTAYTITNNAAKAADMAREMDLNSLREQVKIK